MRAAELASSTGQDTGEAKRPLRKGQSGPAPFALQYLIGPPALALGGCLVFDNIAVFGFM
jgi:hypothetical protein